VTSELGGYALGREIGRGAAGVVFEGRAPDGRRVAIKVLGRATLEARARFEREARILGELSEADGFVTLLGSGTAPDGKPFVVMPLVAGGTLRARLAKGALPAEEVVALGRALAAALGRAHARGVVHRDLKPENVLLTEDGRPLIADLGIAKHFRGSTDGNTTSVVLSQTGETRGTIGYMPPEQMGDATRAGPPADVFALAAILYEAHAGRPARAS
jgi:serine/threonine protein kinase